MRLLAVAVLMCGAMGGCFDKPDPACGFLCGSGEVCPDGYRCAGDGWCKRNDVAESFVCQEAPPDAMPAMVGPDAMPVADAMPAIDAMPGTDADTDGGQGDAATADAASDGMAGARTAE